MESQVSDQTRAEIFAAEAALLRRKVLVNATVAIIALAAWRVIDGRWGSPMFLLAGYMTVPTGLSLWQWWQHRRAGESAVVGRAEEQTAARDEQVAIAERLHARGKPMTMALIATVCVVGVLQVVLSGSLRASMDAAALVKPAVTSGQWWRLVSSMFLHLSPIHLASNMAALFVLGRLLEGYASRWRLPLVYAVAGVAGSIGSYLFIANTSAGASGAIMGLAGYLAAISYLDPSALPRSARLQIFTMVGINVYLGAFGFGFIDNAAHLGGLTGGAIIAWWCVKREAIDEGLLNALGRVALVCLLVGAGGTVYALRHHESRVAVQSPPVTSALVSFAGSPSAPSAIVKNHSDQSLEAYRIEVRSDRKVVETAWRDDCCFAALSGGEPVAPRSFASVPLSALELRLAIGPPTIHITLAMFADGSYEGRAAEYDLMLKQRQWVADDADYWIHAIAQDRALPPIQWHNALVSRMDERAKLSTFGRPSATVFGIPTLASLIARSPERFDREVDARIAAITIARDELRKRLAQPGGGGQVDRGKIR